RMVVDQGGAVAQITHYYPFGMSFAESTNASKQPYKYNGKELDTENNLNTYDYEARLLGVAVPRFTTVDPLAEMYPSISPYAYCNNNPLRFIDPTGMAWKPTYYEDNEGNRTYNGYEWIDEDKSYDEDGNLLAGLYAQAIFFSDNGTFDSTSRYNMGSSTATVYQADGTTTTFDANTLPSDLDSYATVPEGIYHATVGKHKNSYIALRMSDTNNSGQIELGAPNPAHPDRTYAADINIHKPGLNNLTGLTTKGAAVSQGCLLIDRNEWTNFIGIFNNDSQKSNTVSVTVSRTLSTPVNVNRLPAFNFFSSGYRSDFFKNFNGYKIMKITFILFTILFFIFPTSNGFAQKKHIESINKYDNEGSKHGYWIEEDKYQQIELYYKHGLKSGLIKYYNKDWRLSCLGEYNNNSMSGTWYYFGNKGHLMVIQKDFTKNDDIIIDLDSGIRHKYKYKCYTITFYPNGYKQSEGILLWDEDPQSDDTYEYGTWNYYNEQGEPKI
ncbi:MAG: RHS repeat-associated core domain-containing protein, partial [Clostridiales bacterium]|nr:RHS repeat-associated core domain-containing protein [Clostridiales bacterium]